MLEQHAERLYLKENFNCAETVLMAVNETCGLGMTEEAAKLVGGFGGGMGCGRTCGALCGAIAALGAVKMGRRAHESPGFNKECGDLVKEFEEKMGSSSCAELRSRYATLEKRCLKTVLAVCDLLENHLEETAK